MGIVAQASKAGRWIEEHLQPLDIGINMKFPSQLEDLARRMLIEFHESPRFKIS